MALNSYVTRWGDEIGRAQVAQAEAAGIDPIVQMNPVLLKPTGNQSSQGGSHGETGWCIQCQRIPHPLLLNSSR